jgi:hypothetical protein
MGRCTLNGKIDTNACGGIFIEVEPPKDDNEHTGVWGCFLEDFIRKKISNGSLVSIVIDYEDIK